MKPSAAIVFVVSMLASGCTSTPSSTVTPPPVDDAGTGADGGPSCTRIGATTDAGVLDVGPIVTAATPPPALSGGTLLVTVDGHYAVAADPDRDVVWVADLVLQSVHAQIALQSGDDPGRLVEDSTGRVHVVLRGGGGVVSIDPAAGAILARRAVCTTPRGLAYDPATDLLHVACAGGELVSLPAAGGAAVRTVLLDTDLRDVVVSGPNLLVSRFRSAEVLQLDATGTVQTSATPSSIVRTQSIGGGESVRLNFDPDVAWRMVSQPSGGALVLHQRAQSSQIVVAPMQPSYYGAQFSDGCGPGIVHSTITGVALGGTVSTGAMLDPTFALPIDLALSASGTEAAIIAAGSTAGSRVRLIRTEDLWSVPCDGAGTPLGTDLTPGQSGRPVAVAFVGTSNSNLVVQTREPAALWVLGGSGSTVGTTGGVTIALAADSHFDTGHEMFHSVFGAPITCAGCHPEGGDDGHTWTFQCDGARRTQSLRGGLLATAPFHWDGHLPTFEALADEVFVERLGAPRPTSDQATAMANWLNQQQNPTPPPPADPAAVARGQLLFSDPSVACSSCHTGQHFTNNLTLDVGTGGAFQVPSLNGVFWRAPYLHNGCAPTLRDRFGSCGGGDAHGHTSQLSSDQISDLIAYLQTL